ncbi:MAG TPA: family 20 glycosylhydrolase [Tahibacter sp.]|uniref:beta-N-acetylhexosaminidase n=1 Tax=Tahibacter sp. TaxID=2056211 RepID=UPI002CCB5332|nr:family 20 glycosylhydrolase [Tahibacter sp.]HSX60907.1 family 20 glycosylhydrolase [Tahibacter sp.]
MTLERFARFAGLAAFTALMAACAHAPTGDKAGAVAKAPAVPLDAIVPMPAQIEPARSAPVRIDATTAVDACGDEAQAAARYFVDLVQRTRGFALAVDCAAKKPARGIRFVFHEGRDALAGWYRLKAEAGVIEISSGGDNGLFYGAVSLWQLLTAQPGDANAPVAIGAGAITDFPRYPWRGLMLDSARHYQPPDFIKKLIDAMALHKLNTLHWHLTDDQGWRIEIKKYPRLTDVGAWRVPPGPAAAKDIDPATGKPRRYGGYYTQDEIRDIVAYAAQRHITIVPEIDMPGHAQAAIAAYPELGTGEKPAVSTDWGVHTYLLNVDESTFEFIDGVLDEVVELFPSRYIHIGGDEAAKDRWKASRRVQARRRQLGLADDAALQSWFVGRLEKMLEEHDRKLIGWDEILEGGTLPASASVMSWRGTAGAIEAAREGHDVVLSPSPDLYLDNLQSDRADEPSGRPYLVTLEKLYGFEPTPAELDAEQAKHVRGAQVNVWVEHMRTTARVEHAVFPRLAAIAEVTWSPRERRDWQGFLARLPAQFARYRALDIGYAESAFLPRATLAADAAQPDAVSVTLANQTGFGTLRYTRDGSEPTAASPAYEAAISVPAGTPLRAATFAGDAPLTRSVAIATDAAALRRRTSGELKPCRENGLVIRLEDDAPLAGERPFYSVDIFDACWIWPQADLAASSAIEVDVGSLPYNFQLWHDTKNIVRRKPATAHGELEIRRGGCTGKPWLKLPLKPAAGNVERTTLQAKLPRRGTKSAATEDLCFVFTRPDTKTLWAVDQVRLVP